MSGDTGNEKLKGKVAIVAGGTSGIGRAIAMAYAREGASVVVADVNSKSAEDGTNTADRIDKSGGNAVFVQTDISDEKEVTRLVKSTVDAFGRIDVLVNSAGISLKKSIQDTSSEDFDRMYAVTVKGPYLLVKHCLPYLKESKDGRVINIASNFSFTAQPNLSAYTIAKAAVIGLTNSLAVELGPSGINVNAICPGATKTETSRPYWGTPEGVAYLEPRIPLRKNGRYVALPDEVARIAVFLASDDSLMITGESILIDGGWNTL